MVPPFAAEEPTGTTTTMQDWGHLMEYEGSRATCEEGSMVRQLQQAMHVHWVPMLESTSKRVSVRKTRSGLVRYDDEYISSANA